MAAMLSDQRKAARLFGIIAGAAVGIETLFSEAMCCGGVLVHCPCRLGAAVSVLAPEVPCGDGVFAMWALKRGKAVHHFDGVMSHSFNCRRLSRCDSELKLPSPRLRLKWQVLALTKSVNECGRQ